LDYTEPRLWIEEELQELSRGRHRKLVYVKGCNGSKGNEEADRMVRRLIGVLMQKLAIETRHTD